MRKINKKGFSLIELIVAVAILILIVAVLVPQYRQSSIKAKEKADFASVESLETAVKLALQDTAYKASETEGETGQPINMYQLCKDAVANSQDKNMVVEFYVSEDTVYPKTLSCKIDNVNNLEIKQYLIDVIGSELKPVVLESDLYKTYKFKFTFTFPDVDMKVNSTIETIEHTFVMGDLNSDGKVDTADRAMLIDYVQLGQNEHTLNLSAADLNVDGKIDDKDTTIIREHLSGNEAYKILPYIKR